MHGVKCDLVRVKKSLMCALTFSSNSAVQRCNMHQSCSQKNKNKTKQNKTQNKTNKQKQKQNKTKTTYSLCTSLEEGWSFIGMENGLYCLQMIMLVKMCTYIYTYFSVQFAKKSCNKSYDCVNCLAPFLAHVFHKFVYVNFVFFFDHSNHCINCNNNSRSTETTSRKKIKRKKYQNDMS